MDAKYVPSGHLVYLVGSTLMAVPFDLGRMETAGSPVPVLEEVYVSGDGPRGGFGAFSVSRTGVLVYASGANRTEDLLVQVDREGRATTLVEGAEQLLLPEYLARSESAGCRDRRGYLDHMARARKEPGDGPSNSQVSTCPWSLVTSTDTASRVLFPSLWDQTTNWASLEPPGSHLDWRSFSGAP